MATVIVSVLPFIAVPLETVLEARVNNAPPSVYVNFAGSITLLPILLYTPITTIASLVCDAVKSISAF